MQVAIHTDTLNESGYVEDTIRAFGGRTIHTYHTEGPAAGTLRTSSGWLAFANVLPSSTNPTMPLYRQHHGRTPGHADGLPSPLARIPEDVAFAESRIRPETIAAEDVLHDMGVFSA